MTLPQKDRDFIHSRRLAARIGFWVTIVAAVLVAGFAVYTWFHSRWLIDPFYVAREIESGAIDPGVLQILAVMAPLLFGACLGLLMLLMLLAAWMLRTEQRYLAIIDTLDQQD